MNTRSKTGIEILQVALVIGLLGNILLRQMPWGLNVFLFNLVFVGGAVFVLMRRKPEYLTHQIWALLGAQLFFAAMFVWRASEELHFADSVAIVAAMSVVIVPKLGIAPRVAGVLHYGVGFIWSSLNAAFGSIPLLTMDIDWKTGDRSAFIRNAVAVLRGVLIVAPFMLIFGALFVAADAAFEGLVNRVFDFNIDTALSHIFITVVFAWASAGYLRAITLGKVPMTETASGDQTGGNTSGSECALEPVEATVVGLNNDEVESSGLPNNATILEHINRSDPPQTDASVPDASSETPKPKWSWSTIDNSFLPSAFTLGPVEIAIIFGLIDLLFVSFVVVQIPYLFGGMDLVQNTPDFKLAEYARRGFGELVAVAALVLPLLLVAHWLIQKESARASALFKALAGVQVVLLFVIMASAVQRLVILTGPLGYGLTTVRLYPMIFMTWLAIVFVWFAVTVLRGYRQYFAWGALWSAFFILAATHVFNPDDFIVRTNIRLMQQGRQFDARYNADLSADATPALLESEAPFNDQDAQTVFNTLARRHCHETSDMRSSNYSRWKASRVLNENSTLYEKVGGCATDPPANDGF
jgi:hypothetical protein